MARALAEVFKLLDYNAWANARTVGSVSELSDEEWGKPLGGSFASVRDTLAHIYSAEWIWLERWKGTSPKALPGSQEVTTLPALKEKWGKVEEDRRAFARGLTEARLTETLAYSNLKGESKSNALGELFVHVVNHSSYHRGQVATLLRQLGRKPVSTDYVAFLDTAGK